MPPLPIDSAATALLQTWVALLSPTLLLSFVFHAAGFVELGDFPVLDVHLSIPHLGHTADPDLASTSAAACNNSSSPPSLSRRPSLDPKSLCLDLAPITTRQATEINGAGGWAVNHDDTRTTAHNYPTTISQGSKSMFRERFQARDKGDAKARERRWL